MPADAGHRSATPKRTPPARRWRRSIAPPSAAMRELPIYNPALQVAAIGFRAREDQAFGVVVTPWFMNLVRVPLDRPGCEWPQGTAVAHALPAGALEFTVGETRRLRPDRELLAVLADVRLCRSGRPPKPPPRRRSPRCSIRISTQPQRRPNPRRLNRRPRHRSIAAAFCAAN